MLGLNNILCTFPLQLLYILLNQLVSDLKVVSLPVNLSPNSYLYYSTLCKYTSFIYYNKYSMGDINQHAYYTFICINIYHYDI